MTLDSTLTVQPTTGLPATGMTPQEKRHLGALERRISQGLQTFREVGAALLEIRDQRLYRETHSSFESYCNERWSLNRSRAYQLMDSARVVTLLGSPEGLTNEAQARELAPLNDSDIQKVWARVGELTSATHQPLTASLIRRIRTEVVHNEPSAPPIVHSDEPSLTDRVVQDMTRLGNAYTRWVESEPTAVDKRRMTAAKRTLVGILSA